MAFLPLVLFVPALLIRFPVKRWLTGISILALFILLSFLAYRSHKNYYIRQNPGWAKQEEFRQHLFYAFNRPVDTGLPVFKDSIERGMFFSFYLYDSTRFTSSRVKEISHGITRGARLDKKDTAGLYWTFIDLRIYILLFAVFVLYAWVERQKKILARWLPALGIYLAVQAGLYLFLKSTMNIHLGLLLYLWIMFCLSLDPLPALDLKKIKNGVMITLWMILSAWMGWRLIRESRENREKNGRLQCMMAEIGAHPGNLFVVFGDILPLSHFHIWDLPARHSLPNVMYKDRMLTFTYPHPLSRFGIRDIDSAVRNDDRVRLVGKPVLDDSVRTGSVDEFKCMDVRAVVK
jgi:hypothetical protein